MQGSSDKGSTSRITRQCHLQSGTVTDMYTEFLEGRRELFIFISPMLSGLHVLEKDVVH